ncbi:MAG: sulfite exporter TauE/SafE family protein [Limisphaerales bacterium]
MTTLLLLSVAAFFAGFVDSIAGGGGLIQLPALFVILPPSIGANVAQVMGINKFSSICGTTVATLQYARKVKFRWGILIPIAACAWLFSILGARTVSIINPAVIKPVILALLAVVAVYTYTRKKTVPGTAWAVPENLRVPLAIAVGGAIGFYDGFFGPGTGTFLLIAFVGFFALDFLNASAHAKAVNLATNIAAVSVFAWQGNIPYYYAVPMAAANVAGSFIGSRMAILKGSEFIRKFLLAVVLVLIMRFAYEMAFPR